MPASERRQRLFFALWPGEGVRRRLLAEQRRVVGGRSVAPANLHLTLAFLGDCDQQQARQAASAAAAAVSAASFRLRLSVRGRWRSGVVWLAPEASPPELTILVEQLQTRLAMAGFPRERHGFLPHITLARRTPEQPAVDVPPIAWSVMAYRLVVSHPGPHYAPVQEWRLAMRKPVSGRTR